MPANWLVTTRRAAPPTRFWYLPGVIDSSSVTFDRSRFDTIEDLQWVADPENLDPEEEQSDVCGAGIPASVDAGDAIFAPLRSPTG